MTGAIIAIEHGEDPDIASVCYVEGDLVYEDPKHAEISKMEAVAVAKELNGNHLGGYDPIRSEWTLIS